MAEEKRKPNKEEIEKVYNIMSKGAEAIKRGTFSGSDVLAIAQLQIHLDGFIKDLHDDYERMKQAEIEIERKAGKTLAVNFSGPCRGCAAPQGKPHSDECPEVNKKAYAGAA